MSYQCCMIYLNLGSRVKTYAAILQIYVCICVYACVCTCVCLCVHMLNVRVSVCLFMCNSF